MDMTLELNIQHTSCLLRIKDEYRGVITLVIPGPHRLTVGKVREALVQSPRVHVGAPEQRAEHEGDDTRNHDAYERQLRRPDHVQPLPSSFGRAPDRRRRQQTAGVEPRTVIGDAC